MMIDNRLIDYIFLISLLYISVVVLSRLLTPYLYQVPLLFPLHQMFLSQMDTIQLVQAAIMVIAHSNTSPPPPSDLTQSLLI